MNEPNETTEMWRQIRHEKQQRHASNYERNRAILDAAGISYTDKGETLLFREAGKPKVNFYPSTGRWHADKRLYDGGAKAFLSWYAKQPA